MNMCTVGTGTHHQISSAQLQYFKGWLHSTAPTLQVVIECNLRSTSLERALSCWQLHNDVFYKLLLLLTAVITCL